MPIRIPLPLLSALFCFTGLNSIIAIAFAEPTINQINPKPMVCHYNSTKIIYAKTEQELSTGFQYKTTFSNEFILFDLTSFPIRERQNLTTHMRNVSTDILAVYYNQNKELIGTQYKPQDRGYSKSYALLPKTAYFIEVPLAYPLHQNSNYLMRNIPLNLNQIRCN